MRQLIIDMRVDFDAIDEAARLRQHYQEIQMHCNYVETTQQLLLTHLVEIYMTQKQHAGKRIGLGAKHDFSWASFTTQFAHRSLPFPTWMAILNRQILKRNNRLEKLTAMFREYMRSTVEPRVVTWVSEHAKFATPVVSLRARMKYAFKLPYGSRLRVFMETAQIMQGFCVDIKTVGSADWQPMYEFLIVNLESDELMKSFIVWNASVLAFKLIRRFAHDNVFDALMNGFATMLVDNPDIQHEFEGYEPSFKQWHGN
jgi:hypothetical protein